MSAGRATLAESIPRRMDRSLKTTNAADERRPHSTPPRALINTRLAATAGGLKRIRRRATGVVILRSRTKGVQASDLEVLPEWEKTGGAERRESLPPVVSRRSLQDCCGAVTWVKRTGCESDLRHGSSPCGDLRFRRAKSAATLCSLSGWARLAAGVLDGLPCQENLQGRNRQRVSCLPRLPPAGDNLLAQRGRPP